MTLVARLIVSDYPLLMGDLLISGNEPPSQSLRVPTVGDTSNVVLARTDFFPRSLVQKLAIIGDNIAIGWAGSRLAAKITLRDLIAGNQVSPFGYDSLMDYFEKLDGDLWEMQVGFLGFIKERDGVRSFGAKSATMELVDSGDICLIGTGSETFAGLQLGASSANPASATGRNALERALISGLGFSGTLLGVELNTDLTLGHYFGGGYEIASLIDGRFQKLSKVTRCFWLGEIRGSRMQFRLQQAVGYEYLGESLVIRAVSFASTGQSASDETFVVPPLVSLEPPLHHETKVNLNAKWICNHFLVPKTESNGSTVFSVFTDAGYASSVETAKVRFSEDDKGIGMGFQKPWLEEIMQSAFETYGP